MADILVVDDEPTVREALAGVLVHAGHRVTAAVDGRQALDLFEEEACDLILTDVIMPRMNGFELIREIQQRIHHRIPLIVLSSHSDPAGIEGAIYAGAFDYIMKPAAAEAVLEVVDRALEQGRAWAAEGASPPPTVPSLPNESDDPDFKRAGPAAFATRQQSVTVPLPPTPRDEAPVASSVRPFGRFLRALHLR